MKSILTTEQQMSIRLHALGMAVRNLEGQPAQLQVDAADTYFNFVTDGLNPVGIRRQATVDEVKAEAAAEAQVSGEEPLVPFTVDPSGKVDCADPDVTGSLEGIWKPSEGEAAAVPNIEEALLSKYVDILRPVLHDRLTSYIGGHGVMDLLHVGPIGIGEGPFSAEEKNLILKVLLQVQKEFDADLGINEGDSFCDNCNNIHPKLDFDNPIEMVKTLRAALGKGRMGGIPTFADFLKTLGGEGDEGATAESARLSRLRDMIQEKVGDGFEIATHVIKLQPGETPEQGIARHLKENPIPGMELGPNGELPVGVVKLDDSQTRH